MNQVTHTPVNVSVIGVDIAAANIVKSVAQSLSFRSNEFASVGEFLNAMNLITPSCVVLCAGDQAHVAKDFQSKLYEHGVQCPSVIIITDIEIRDAVKLMEKGAMTILTSEFDQAELAEYLTVAAKKDRERRQLQARVEELESCREALSDRQLKILNMVEQGHSNRQIANWFDLSQRTIELERARLMSAFQSASVAQLVSKWTELRVLTKTWHKTDSEENDSNENVLNA